MSIFGKLLKRHDSELTKPSRPPSPDHPLPPTPDPSDELESLQPKTLLTKQELEEQRQLELGTNPNARIFKTAPEIKAKSLDGIVIPVDIQGTPLAWVKHPREDTEE